MVLEKTTRVTWTARRSNQSILKEINSEYSLEGLMLKLQYFGLLMQKANSLEKTLMLEKIEGRKQKGMTEDEIIGWPHWLNGYEFEQTLWDGEGQGSLVCCSSWGHKELDMTEWLNWLRVLLTQPSWPQESGWNWHHFSKEKDIAMVHSYPKRRGGKGILIPVPQSTGVRREVETR